MTPLRISTDPSALDVPMIHRFLASQSGWARGIPLEVVETSLRHSLCFAGFIDAEQVAFARVISDQATFAYLADVFVLPAYRGRGYAAALLAAIVADARLQGLRRFLLATADSHALYARFGFTRPAHPERFMQRHVEDAYARSR